MKKFLILILLITGVILLNSYSVSSVLAADKALFKVEESMTLYQKDFDDLKNMFIRVKDDKVQRKLEELALYTYAVNNQNISCNLKDEYKKRVYKMFDMRGCYIKHYTDQITIDDLSEEIEAYCKIYSHKFPKFDGTIESLDNETLVYARKFILEKSLSKLQDEKILPNLRERYRITYEK